MTKAVSTPDSIPSLSETTRASSDSGEHSPRVLFDESHEQEYETFISRVVAQSRSNKQADLEKDSIFESDASVASPTSWPSEEDDVDSRPVTAINSSPRGIEGDVADSKATKRGQSSYSPRQLVDMFHLFDGNRGSGQHRRYKSSDSTIMTSNMTQAAVRTRSPPKVDSLERECATLKEIIKGDSVHIIRLKASMERQQEETSDLRQELELVKKERDLLKERESQHTETMKILKKEIDALTQDVGVDKSPETHKELEQLRIENELFASQIIENEIELREARSVLSFLDSENGQMRKELDAVQGKLDADKETAPSSSDIVAQIRALEARVDEVERERDHANQRVIDGDRRRTEEIESVKKMIMENQLVLGGGKETFPSPFGRPESLAIVDSVGEAIEVTIDGEIMEAPTGADGTKDADNGKEKRGSWNLLLCDCFPSSDAGEEKK